MKQFTVTAEKIFRVYKAFDCKNQQSYRSEDYPPAAFGIRLSV